MSQPPSPTAAILVIGNEILAGSTQDANIAYIARHMNLRGIRVMEVRVVPDIPAAIVGAVNALRAAYTYVFTTGGIGPTHDDITADCVDTGNDRRCGSIKIGVRTVHLHHSSDW